MPVSKTIPLHLLDDPDIAMRSEIDEDYLAGLASDIAKNGLINPVAVRKVSDRYIVIAGHCRTIACRRLGKDNIEVRDYTGDTIDPETIKCRENLGRRDVSDADVAVYLAEIQEKNHYTIDRLMEITGESESWINTRLSLFAGDRAVFEALRTKQIKLSHAVMLNRFPDQYRAQYLDIAINSTPPARLLEDWLRQVKMQMTVSQQPATDQQPPQPEQIPPGVVVEGCELCRGTELNWTMKFYRIHDHCFRMIADAIHAQEKG